MLERLEEEKTDAAAPAGLELGLLPWQKFVLSVLLFLDVVLIGALFLLVLGSVQL
ncbi:MAG: hypothetical protein U9Q70_13580 [Chloroflexota bacterium]|nr:hypothetical protein [Chloroflexota bacterium]